MCRYCLGYRNSDFDIDEALKVHTTAGTINKAFKSHEAALLKLKSLVTEKGKVKEIDARHKAIIKQRKAFNRDYYANFLL